MSENELSAAPDLRRKKSLDDLMDPNRPLPAEYSLLTQRKSVIDIDTSATPFARYWTELLDFNGQFGEDSPHHDRMQHFFRARLRQQVLVDLGGGPVPGRNRNILSARPMADLAKACDADTYINVDILHSQSTREEELDGLQLIETGRELLDFVAHMKDSSANFAINGIEKKFGADPYFKALEQEVVRATRKGGIIFGFQSDFAFLEFCQGKKPLLKQVTSELIGHAFLYEKIE